MTPRHNERWATAPANDGRKFAPAHRWAVVAARPLCFGRVKTGAGIGELVPGCREEFERRGCLFEGLTLRPSELSLAEALLRVYIREAHELRHRIKVMEWLLKSRHVMGEAFDRVRHSKMQILLDRVATLEAENAALRGKQPRCPDCGHRLDTEECGCGGDA